VAFGDKGVRSLETARECALLGARKRTIAWITGLPPTFILRNVFDRYAGQGTNENTEQNRLDSHLMIAEE